MRYEKHTVLINSICVEEISLFHLGGVQEGRIEETEGTDWLDVGEGGRCFSLQAATACDLILTVSY